MSALNIQDVFERWLPVPGWPYEVSDRGRIRNRRGRVIKQQVSNNGYLRIELTRGAEARKFLVHQLVAAAFLAPCPGIHGRRRGQYQLNHIDGDKRNNWPDNLEWVTTLENHQHAAREGLKASGESHHNSKLTEDDVREIRRRALNGESHSRIAVAFGVARPTVSAIVGRRLWQHVRSA